MKTVDEFAPVTEEKTYVNYGEIVLHDHFDGVWLKGNREPEKYDPSKPEHAGIEKWKVNHFFHLQFCPHNSQFESYPQYWKKDGSKKYPPIQWETFFNSLVHVLDGKSPGEFLRKHLETNEPFYGAWETVVVDSYTKTNDDGTTEEKEVYSKKMVALYATYDEMIEAYKAAFPEKDFEESVDQIPGFETGTVETPSVDIQQALPFVKTLAAQVANGSKTIDLNKLQEKIDEMPLLGALNAQSPEVE